MLKIKPEDLKKLLLKNNLLTEKKIEEIEKSSADQHVSVADLLISKKIITEKDLVKLYGEVYKIPFIDLSKTEIKKDTLQKLSEKIARRYQAVVFDQEKNSYKIAMSDPLDIQAVQFIEKELGYSAKFYIASATDISLALDLYKEGLTTEISKVIKETEGIEIDEKIEDKITAGNVQEIVQEAPIARALTIILEYAVKSRASDIHFEPRENLVQVRFRVDGILQDTMTLPKPLLSSLVTRIKILSNLRIDEHRVPQDGRIKLKIGPRVISIRVSTLPIVDGEKVVMRLLDESTKAPTLDELGYAGTALSGIKEALSKPHGMLLVTGPTGSGKSTTLYASISMLNSMEVNISTVEDPIEYRISGVNQTQVNTKTGMTFASGLRALLRQDPDIIMVGEIRDTETAEMAVHAALTGHVVLSTLHTNNAAGCLPRLLDMGVEPFLIASTVNAVVGQRLVRRLCPECRESYQASKEQLEELKRTFHLDHRFLTKKPTKETLKEILKKIDSKEKTEFTFSEKGSILDQISQDPEMIKKTIGQNLNKDVTLREVLFDRSGNTKHVGEESLTLFHPVGCKKCSGTGYSGRVGIYEVLEMSDEIGEMIVGRASTDDLAEKAIEKGMITMAEDGFVKAVTGVTTVEEILRVTRE